MERYKSVARRIKAGGSPEQIAELSESLTHCPDTGLVRATLVPLLKHENAEVRIGAIIGLWDHLTTGDKVLLARMSEYDSSEDVRSWAKDALGL